MSPPKRARGNALSKELAELFASNPHDGLSISLALGTIVRCLCQSQRKTGTVQCIKCRTHQHAACYYPAIRELSDLDQQRHLCRSCRALFAKQPTDSQPAKRKADEDLGSTSPKRIKQSNSPQPEIPADPKDPRPAGKPVPFPEKVESVDQKYTGVLCADWVLARCHRRTQWRDRVPCRQQRQ